MRGDTAIDGRDCIGKLRLILMPLAAAVMIAILF
jgi:hypothetical protein